MIRTIIIDDEPLAIQLVEEYLSEFPEFNVLTTCLDGFQGLKEIQNHHPDLIFLDVQMPKINGFEMLELLENPPAIIFTTAFDEFAIRAFDAHALDYLLKPFSRERFSKALEKYLQRDIKTSKQDPIPAPLGRGMTNRIVLKIKNEIKIIPIPEVKYLEANDDYVNIYTAEGKFLKNKTLRSFEMTLDPELFVRIHRSYMVRVAEITKIEQYEKDSHILKIRDGSILPISKKGFSRLKIVLGL